METKEFKNIGTHETHCCLRHGCKYGYPEGECAVEAKAVVQSGACPYCESTELLKSKIAELNEELKWSESLEARGLTIYDGGW